MVLCWLLLLGNHCVAWQAGLQFGSVVDEVGGGGGECCLLGGCEGAWVGIKR